MARRQSWTMFHDSTLLELRVRWEERIADAHVIYFSDGVRRESTIRATSVSSVMWQHESPWGESNSINEIRETGSGDHRTLEIEMQSGDVLKIQGAAFTFEEGED